MPKTANLNYELETALKENEIQQKWLALETKTPKGTVHGHVSGGNIRAEKAIEYSDVLESDLLKSQLSYKYIGFIKSMDGQVAEILTPTELDFLQNAETKEREERRAQAINLLIKSRLEPLEQQDHQNLENYVLEFLDEIVVELTIVFSILKILRLSITEAFKRRMPYWIKKKYMKG